MLCMYIYHLIAIFTSNVKLIAWVRGSIELVVHAFDRFCKYLEEMES